MRQKMEQDARDTRADEGSEGTSREGDGGVAAEPSGAKVPRDGSTYALAKRLQLESKDLPAAEAAFHQARTVPSPIRTHAGRERR